MDEVVQMMTGLAYMTGPTGRPLRIGSSANDIMGGLFGAFAVVVAPWNLLMWYQLARLRRAVELDCDGRLLRCGIGRRFDFHLHQPAFAASERTEFALPRNVERQVALLLEVGQPRTNFIGDLNGRAATTGRSDEGW